MQTIRIAHPTGASTATHTFEADEPVELPYEDGLALSLIPDGGFYVVDVPAKPKPKAKAEPEGKADDEDPDRLDDVSEVGTDEGHAEHGGEDEAPAAAKKAPAKRAPRRRS